MQYIIINIFESIFINNQLTHYAVNPFGQIKNTKTGKELKPQRFNNGRQYVNIYLNGRMYRRLTYRLVAEAFIPNPHNYPVVNHLDGNIDNNVVMNLEWTTFKGNTIHALENNLIKSIGENSHLNKYQEEMVISICDDLEMGMTPKELSLKYGLSQSYITYLRGGKMWRHITNEYEFPERSDFNYSSKYSIELKESIRSLVKDGYSNKEIRKECGLPHTPAIRNMIDRIRKQF